METTAAAADEQHEPSIDTDKLSYEIFSILESKFLFGYDDQKLWIPRPLTSSPSPATPPLPPALDHPAAATATASIKNQRGKVCILSIDGGGGMRGILPGKALAYLEQSLKSRSGDPDARISDYFDVAAGTGVGGIFTAMLFATRDGRRPIFRADDTWRLLADQGKRFFRRSSPSASKSYPGGLLGCLFGGGGCRGGEKAGCGGVAAATVGVERAMKEAFGEGLTLRDTVKPVLIPCYDLRSAAPFLFSRADALEAEGFNFRLWEVCRATWAEPGRFEPVELRSVDGATRCVAVDGGLAMSNPASAAITHVLHNKQEFPFVRGVEDLLVLSLGSGGAVWMMTPETAEGGGGGGSSSSSQHNNNYYYEYEQVKRWKAKEWARPVARIASDGAADLVDHAVTLAFGQCRSSNYVRIQADGSSRFGPNVDWDPSPGNVKMLVGAAEEMLLKQKNVESVLLGGKRIGEQTNSEKLDWFAGELVLEHRRRSCRIAPTVAFKQPTARAAP